MTGEPDPDALLARAKADLAAKKKEAAAYGRSVWKEIFPGTEPPASDTEVLTKLFARVSADHAKTTEEFVDDYRKQVADLNVYLHAHEIVTIPDPLTLYTDRSPGFFVGQSVGGVYAAGPYAPDAKTLWFLPTPSDSATPAERDGFFRDFNHHFNVMITPHEILPGHYLQLKVAAHHPRKVRALFSDGVYVEGWGTFSERLMLDLGWGGPLDRLAHLKKQMENIARAIVDVQRAHQGHDARRGDPLRPGGGAPGRAVRLEHVDALDHVADPDSDVLHRVSPGHRPLQRREEGPRRQVQAEGLHGRDARAGPRAGVALPGDPAAEELEPARIEPE